MTLDIWLEKGEGRALPRMGDVDCRNEALSWAALGGLHFPRPPGPTFPQVPFDS